MRYSSKFKKRMLSKMTGPGARSATSLSDEVGVCQSTLSRWLREATVEGMVKDDSRERAGGREKRRGRWTPTDKIRVVMEAAGVGEEGLGALLRREGLHEADLERFREEVLEAAVKGFEVGRRKRGMSAEEKKIRALRKELNRKEKALAEAAALLVLRKKVEAFLMGDEEGDMDEKSEK